MASAKRPAGKPIRRLLVANRGEIACRIIRSAQTAGMEAVAIYSDPDRGALHTMLAQRAMPLGGDSPATSYLAIDKILEAAKQSKADAIHPGYGFLAENAEFARRVEQAGLRFVGPTAESIEVMGDKIRAREAAIAASVPVIPSAPLGVGEKADAEAARQLGFPVLVKAAAGGGGRGMRVVEQAEALPEAIRSAKREAASAFGDDRVFLEKYLLGPRHIEIQVFGDGRGSVVHLGERECSVQRRHQKIIEEAPSPAVDQRLRARMGETAAGLAAAIDYRGAGTVEFVVDASGQFYFLEMNTRLQVEHPVTELVTATDLVRWQLEVAAGADLPAAPAAPCGHAIECRVYAEDPSHDFLPTGGKVLRVDHPTGPGIRVDSALFDGVEIPLLYDPLLAKIVAWGPSRAQALRRLDQALAETAVLGVTTNIGFLRDVVNDADFVAGNFTTTTVDERYACWRPDADRGEALIAKVAGALLSLRGPSTAFSSTGGADGGGKPPGPWQTLGAWRLGGGRSE